MICPNCTERFTLWKMFKFWFTINIPYSVYMRLEKRKQDTELQQLIKLYNTSANLTEREHFVCASRVAGHSIKDVALSMTVTVERIRQIQAKALRKLQRALIK